MKLLLIDPIQNPAFDEMIGRALDRSVFMPDTEITIRSLTRGPASIEGFVDEMLAAPYVLELIAAEENNFDGFFINCCGDVGVDGAREFTKKPVLGAGEASFFLAAAAGVPFSVVTIGDNAKNKMNYRYRELGCSRFVSGVGIPLGVLALNDDPDATAEHIIRAAEKERAERGMELLVLGCTGMIAVAERIRARVPYPVIEPSLSGLKLLETFVALGISHAQGGKYTACAFPEV